jgi:hypothetical protein
LLRRNEFFEFEAFFEIDEGKNKIYELLSFLNFEHRIADVGYIKKIKIDSLE